MADISMIGEFQLTNLHRNRVPFLFLDLSEGEPSQHRLLKSSVQKPASEILNFVRDQNFPSNHPIVLICENGSKSMAVAQQLEENSYINVFVVEGGMQALGK